MSHSRVPRFYQLSHRVVKYYYPLFIIILSFVYLFIDRQSCYVDRFDISWEVHSKLIIRCQSLIPYDIVKMTLNKMTNENNIEENEGFRRQELYIRMKINKSSTVNKSKK